MTDPATHIALVNILKLHQLNFQLVPEFLEHNHSDIEGLNWEEVKFNSGNKINVPDERGLYAFTVRSSKLGLPKHGYIMYIGMTGNTGSSTLKKRFSNYLTDKEAATVKRPKVYEMLTRWETALYFQFTTVSDTSTDLRDLEKRLNDIFQSPCATQDFTANVRKARMAF